MMVRSRPEAVIRGRGPASQVWPNAACPLWIRRWRGANASRPPASRAVPGGGWASLKWEGGDGDWEVLEGEPGPEVLTGPLRLPKGSKRKVPRNQLQ